MESGYEARGWFDVIFISLIFQAMTKIQFALKEPDPDDFIVPEIAHEFRTNRAQFNAKAKEWTELYAMKNESSSKVLHNVEQ